MFTLIRLCIYGAILIFGSNFVLNHFPSLRAQIIEVINPMAQENQLLDQLQGHLNNLSTNYGSLDTAHLPVSIQSHIAQVQQELQQSQATVRSITQLRADHSSILQQTTSKITDTITHLIESSPTPIATPGASICPPQK